MPRHSHRALVVPLQPVLLTRQLAQVRAAELRLHKIQADLHRRHGPDSDWFLCTHELCVFARETLQEILNVTHFTAPSFVSDPFRGPDGRFLSGHGTDD